MRVGEEDVRLGKMKSSFTSTHSLPDPIMNPTGVDTHSS